MNANELADELTKMFRGEEYDRRIHEIPDMLRQQQAEIEELKAKLQLHEAMDNQCASLMQQFRKASEK
jgi:DNA repair ATPase RecN